MIVRKLQHCFISEFLLLFWSNLIQSWPCTFAVHHEKSFVAAFFKGYIDHLFDNLEPGIRNYCLEKGLEKSLEFWIKKSV